MALSSLYNLVARASRPVWGAWIEIFVGFVIKDAAVSRAPYGARGLKYFYGKVDTPRTPVAPRMGRVD